MIKKEDLFLSPSLYSLFLYMLINKNWERSDFVLSDRIPLVIHQRLRDLFKAEVYTTQSSNPKSNILRKIIFNNFQYIKYLKYSLGKSYNYIWGNDEFFFSSKYRNQGIKLIEDGPFNKETKDFFKIRRNKQERLYLNYWFYWYFKDYIPYGYDSKVKQIYHTSSIKLNSEIENKGVLIDLHKIWNSLHEGQKNKILMLFGIDVVNSRRLNKYSTVLVTQVLPIPDEDKISIYEKMVEGIDMSQVLIKTHYAERTDYKKYFPEATVISMPIPMQLFDLLGYSPTKILTISSSAISPFVKPGVDITFLGTECDKRIEKIYGSVKLEDIIKK